MLYKTLQRLPPKGSLQEWVLILYLDRMESIEHARFRALVQVALTIGADDQNPGVEAFDDYMRKAFPGAETKKKKKHESMMAALKEWVGLGAIGVTPMPSMAPRGKSKMVSRISDVVGGELDKVVGQVGGIRPR